MLLQQILIKGNNVSTKQVHNTNKENRKQGNNQGRARNQPKRRLPMLLLDPIYAQVGQWFDAQSYDTRLET